MTHASPLDRIARQVIEKQNIKNLIKANATDAGHLPHTYPLPNNRRSGNHEKSPNPRHYSPTASPTDNPSIVNDKEEEDPEEVFKRYTRMFDEEQKDPEQSQVIFDTPAADESTCCLDTNLDGEIQKYLDDCEISGFDIRKTCDTERNPALDESTPDLDADMIDEFLKNLDETQAGGSGDLSIDNVKSSPAPDESTPYLDADMIDRPQEYLNETQVNGLGDLNIGHVNISPSPKESTHYLDAKMKNFFQEDSNQTQPNTFGDLNIDNVNTIPLPKGSELDLNLNIYAWIQSVPDERQLSGEDISSICDMEIDPDPEDSEICPGRSCSMQPVGDASSDVASQWKGVRYIELTPDEAAIVREHYRTKSEQERARKGGKKSKTTDFNGICKTIKPVSARRSDPKTVSFCIHERCKCSWGKEFPGFSSVPDAMRHAELHMEREEEIRCRYCFKTFSRHDGLTE